MAYATRGEIEEVWGAAFVGDLLPEDVDGDTAIARAIERASAEIDTHLSARYDTPINGHPEALITPAVAIAVYNLAVRHSTLTETVEERYKQAIDLLKRIADGKAGLGADEPHVETGDPNASAAGASFSANGRAFSRKTLP